MKFLPLLFLMLLAACDNCDHQDKIDQLERELFYSQSTRASMLPSYCPDNQCVEDKQLRGCMAYRDYLQANDIKLKKSQWEYCDRFQSK